MSKKEWFGVVPTNWDVIRGRFLFRQSTEKGNKNLVLLSATQDKGIVDKNTLEGVVQVSQNADLMQFKTVHKDDFVISLRSFQGGFEYSAIEGVISPAYSVFRLTPSKFPHYFRHLFKSDTFISKLNSLTTGIREGKNIQYFDFSNILLPVPPIITQQQIANFLDEKCADIDQLITLQQQMIDELKAYKQSVITEAVCKGLDKSVPMKDSGIEWIGEVPVNWQRSMIKHLGSARNGLTYNPQDVTENNNDLLVLRSSNIKDGAIVLEDNVYVNREVKEDLIVKENDILICSRNGSRKLIGKNAIIPNNLKATFGAFMMIYRCNINAKYMYYILNSEVFAYYLSTFLTATINQLTIGNFNNMEFVITTNPFEQETIVSYLDKKTSQIDTLISIKQQKIDELKEYKKSMIYEYITGKKQVPNE